MCYILLHLLIFGGEFGFEKAGKGKDVEIKLTLYNYTKHFKNESIR